MQTDCLPNVTHETKAWPRYILSPSLDTRACATLKVPEIILMTMTVVNASDVPESWCVLAGK